MLEGTRISENSSGSRNIETFSSVLHLLTELISIFQVTNAEQRRIASSFRLTNILHLLTISSCIQWLVVMDTIFFSPLSQARDVCSELVNTLNCAMCAVFVGVLSTRKQGLNTWCFEPRKKQDKKEIVDWTAWKGHFTEDRDKWQQKSRCIVRKCTLTWNRKRFHRTHTSKRNANNISPKKEELGERKGTWKLEPAHWKTRRDKLPAFAMMVMTNLLQQHWEWQEEWNPSLRHGNAVPPTMFLANLDIKTVSDETNPKHVAKFLDTTPHTDGSLRFFFAGNVRIWKNKTTSECVWRVILSSTDACNKGTLEKNHWDSGQSGCRMDEGKKRHSLRPRRWKNTTNVQLHVGWQIFECVALERKSGTCVTTPDRDQQEGPGTQTCESLRRETQD